MQRLKCIFLKTSSTPPTFGVFFILVSILPIPLLTKKLKVIGLQLGLNNPKLNFMDQNKLLKITK